MKNTTTNKKCSDNSRGNKKVTRAAKEYLDRKLRTSHPEGIFDSVGRFNLSAKEKDDCCLGIRAPSRNYKYTEMLHARSALHVANLFKVDRLLLLRRAKELKKSGYIKNSVEKKGPINPNDSSIPVCNQSEQ